MAHPMGKIMTVMARTASSNTKSGGKGSTGKARSGETKVMDAVEPSPVMGVLTKYGRDIPCFILVILAVMFCASEWFRVQGVFGRMLHALASGLFGLMSVILPVFLALVAFSFIYETKRKSGNVRMVAGGPSAPYSTRRSRPTPKVSTWRCCRMREVCSAMCLAARWHGGFPRRSPSLFSWSSFCSRCC